MSTFDRAQIGAAPDIGVRWPSRYIAGVVKRAEGFVVLVDVAQIFSSADVSALRASAA